MHSGDREPLIKPLGSPRLESLQVRILWALLCLVLLALTASRQVMAGEVDVPTLAPGNANGWQSGSVYPLSGHWAFAWHRWLDPGTPDHWGALKPRPLPGVWNEPPDPQPVFGFATYALRLRVPQYLDQVYFAIPDMPSAWRLYANGKLIAHNGRPGISAATERPDFQPKLASASPARGKVTLVLQVSNFHYKEGGVWFPIRTAGPAGLDRLWVWPHVLDAVIVTALLLTGIYLLMVFLLRRREWAAFWFGIFCLLVGFREGLTGQRILDYHQWLSWRHLEQLEFGLLFLAVPAFIRFFCALFPRDGQRWLIRLGDVVGLGFAATTLVAPVYRFADWANLFQAAGVIVCLLILIQVPPLIRKRRPGARLFAFSLVLLLAAIVNDLLMTHFLIHTQPMLPIGSIAFVGCQAMLLDRRYARSLRRVKQLSDQLQDHNARLEAADSAKNEFLTMTSHEMRTPLHAIEGLARELMVGKMLRPEEQGRDLQVIADTAGRLSSLVNDLLDFSAMRHGQLALDLRPVELAPLLSVAFDMIRPLVASESVVLEWHLAAGAEGVLADPDRLSQILVNLLGNAARFTEQGFIRVIAVPIPGGKVRVQVEDSGAGLSDTLLKALSDSGDDQPLPTGNSYRSGGLGLRITRRLVGLHGSDLRFSPRPEGGTCVTLSLSSASRPSAVIAPAPVPSEWKTEWAEENSDPDSETHATVYVVDDDEANRLLVRRILTRAGYRTVLLPSGQALLDRLSRSLPDLILLDIMMPGMDGLEVLQAIRARFDLTLLPVIMLTARQASDDLAQALTAGATDYLTKPFIATELLARIRNQLALKKTWRTREENRILTEELDRQKRFRQTLSIANDRLLNVLEQSREAIVLLTPELKVLYANPRARELTGAPLLFGDDLTRALGEAAMETLGLGENEVPDQPFRTLQLPEGPRLSAKVSAIDELNEQLLVLNLIAVDQENDGAITHLAEEMRASRQRMALLEDLLAELTQRDARDRQRDAPDQAAETAGDDPRALLVRVLRRSLHLWQRATGRDKVALAEESGCWRVYVDGGTAKTRTLDKYLSIRTLPNHPRWRLVVRTVNHVIYHCELPEDETKALEQQLIQIERSFNR